ncbi:cytochrome P450 [Hypoxylon sp. FL1150]|nr:cytochrome P450 [Hypoxylon sp. FL1150]
MVHILKAWSSVLAHEIGSLLVRCRYEHNMSYDLRGRDVAAIEIGQMVASLTNNLVRVNNRGVSNTNSAKAKSSCHVLLSTLLQTLRYVHVGIQVSIVMQDVMFDNKYLLKKGAVVMTASPIQHTDASLWDLTMDTFDHRRVVWEPGGKRTNAAFRSFGGGTGLYLGRQFVSTEVMLFAAEPAAEDGRWADVTLRDKRIRRADFSPSSKGREITTEDEMKKRQA